MTPAASQKGWHASAQVCPVTLILPPASKIGFCSNNECVVRHQLAGSGQPNTAQALEQSRMLCMVPVQPLLQGCKRTFCTKDSRSAVLMLQLQQHHGRAVRHRPRSFFAALSSLPIRWNEASPPCGSVTNDAVCWS